MFRLTDINNNLWNLFIEQSNCYTLSGIVTNQMGIYVQDGDALIFINKLCKRSSLFIIIVIKRRIS